MLRPLARAFLWATGWRADGTPPYEKRFVLIAAPHTSNWDLAYLLALAKVYGVRVSWMGKHTLFRPPMGWLMRRVGGIPVVRERSGNRVALLAELFAQHEELALTVPAEGTRGYAPYWKSGFYHIAREAGVPIVPGYLDYSKKRGGFGPPLHPTGDVSTDMAELRDFYADKIGRYPELFGPVRLKEEL
jgi:1-acyl-sn-glycerol-3-phosphate acyltransferase